MIRKGLIGCIATACALASAGTAFARAGDRSVAQTYPVATALCVKARNSALPKGLVANRAGVLAVCDRLDNAFGPLVTTVDNAEAAYLATLGQQRSLVAAACTRPVASRAACTDARHTAHRTDAATLATRVAAVAAFHAAVEANRATFWTTVAGLRSPSSSTTSTSS